MKTMQTLETIKGADIIAYRALCSMMNDLKCRFEEIAVQSIHGGDIVPMTVQKLCDDLGRLKASAIVATLVNRYDYDGRISRTAKTWAQKGKYADYSYDSDAADEMGIYTNRVHIAHLDQIACEFAAAEKASAAA